MRIGITASLNYESAAITVPTDYVEAVRRARGVPWILPLFSITGDRREPSDYLVDMDGLLLSGGVDLDPARFGEEPLPGLGSVSPERDDFELALTRYALGKGIPILAICRGIQVLNVAAGGSLYQDIESQVGGALGHYQKAPRWHPVHTISLSRETRLAEIIGSSRMSVNSLHHQAVRELGKGMVVAARAPDGIVEAIERPDAPFVIGVQWHPENMVKTSPPMHDLFMAFVEASRRQAEGLS